jgi:predicted SAM-dependent methyltransferase
VKLNLGCWIFYQKGYVNIDRNREVRADRYEDISTLPSFEANCADEIYAGHVAEHVDDVKASFGRWFEVLNRAVGSPLQCRIVAAQIGCGWNENVFPRWS